MTARIDVPTTLTQSDGEDGTNAEYSTSKARSKSESSAPPSGTDEKPRKSSPVRRAFLTSFKCLGFGCAATLSLGFSAYIILKFLTRPVDEWISASNYGKTTQSAVFISGHWIGGIFANVCGLVQIVPFIRRKYPRVHRYSGRVYVFGALVASAFGLIYIFVAGTVGGISMDIAFAIYGFLVFSSSLLAMIYARKRQFDVHRRWGVRSFALATGSTMYRLYVMPLFAGQLAGESSLTADWSHERKILYLNIAAWTFYLPNLVIAEIFIWRSWGYGSRSDTALMAGRWKLGMRRDEQTA